MFSYKSPDLLFRTAISPWPVCSTLILLIAVQLTLSIEYFYKNTYPPSTKPPEIISSIEHIYRHERPKIKPPDVITVENSNMISSIEHVYRHKYTSAEPSAVLPATEKHTATIIFLHGHGQRGVDWTEQLKEIYQPYMKIICPYAKIWPIAFHQGHEMTSWFGIHKGRYAEAHDDAQGMDESTNFVHQLIKKEIRNGILPSRIIIGGYGQGGALAIHAGLSFPQRLGGIATILTFIPMKRTFEKDFNEVNRNIPILNSHLYRPPFLKHDAGYETLELLEQVTNNTHFKFHTGRKKIMERQIQDLKKFCNKYLPRI